MTDTSPEEPLEPRWRRRPSERKAEILEAAIEVLGRKGYDHATLADVATRAGVSTGTVAHYYGTKAALLEHAVAERLCQGLCDEEAFLAAHRGSFRDKVEGLLQRMANRLERPGTAELLMTGLAQAESFPESARAMFIEVGTRWRRLLAGVIEAGIQSGELRPVDPNLTARVLPGALLGLIAVHARFAPFDRTAPQVADLLTSFFDLVGNALTRTSDPAP